jgi:C_GCAxxG_C_C family probable redox protein
VLLAVGEHLVPDWQPQYLRLATGLGGGLGGTHEELCGALSGGVLLIGLLFGRESAGEDDTQAYVLSERYRERFLAALGATQCARLREAIEAPGGPGTCAPLVEQATGILLEILDEDHREA